MTKKFNPHVLNEGEGNEPVKTPLQIAQEEILKARQEALLQINKILDDNGLMFTIEQKVIVVPKQ